MDLAKMASDWILNNHFDSTTKSRNTNDKRQGSTRTDLSVVHSDIDS